MSSPSFTVAPRCVVARVVSRCSPCLVLFPPSRPWSRRLLRARGLHVWVWRFPVLGVSELPGLVPVVNVTLFLPSGLPLPRPRPWAIRLPPSSHCPFSVRGLEWCHGIKDRFSRVSERTLTVTDGMFSGQRFAILAMFSNVFCASKMASDQNVALVKSSEYIKIYLIKYCR